MGFRSTVALVSVFGVCVVVACDRHSAPETHTPTTTPASAVTSPTAPAKLTPTKPPPPTATAALGYTPKHIQVKGQRGSVTYDVPLPQLDGGNPAARDRFNQGMQSALDDLINRLGGQTDRGAQITAGSLSLGYESSRVTGITEHLLAGLAVFVWDVGAAHPNRELATIVINTATAQPITFADVFPNQERAWARLREVVPQLDLTGRLRPNSLEHEKFLNWLPTPDGLRVYVNVSHALGGFAPVTVPWDRIRDLVAPGELPVLAS